MVPNITSNSSFYGMIAYNKIKVDGGTAKVLRHPKIAAYTSGNVQFEFVCRLSIRTLYCIQLARQETGYPYLPEFISKRHSFGRTDDRIGTGVHCGNQPYIVWLNKEIDCNLGSCASSTSLDCCPYFCLSASQKKICTKLRHLEINAVYLYT